MHGRPSVPHRLLIAPIQRTTQRHTSCVEPDMETKTFVQLGDQVVNADNVVSFDIDGADIVRIWYVGSPTPLALKPPVPAAALLEVLHTKQWLL
jgi:hypothetical protein